MKDMLFYIDVLSIELEDGIIIIFGECLLERDDRHTCHAGMLFSLLPRARKNKNKNNRLCRLTRLPRLT